MKLREFDAANYLNDEVTTNVFLSGALATMHSGVIADALGAVARARGMAQLAKDTGLSRAQLYRTLSADGNPRLDTLLTVLKALNVTLGVAEPIQEPEQDAA